MTLSNKIHKKIQALSLSKLLLIALALMLIGILISKTWHSLHYPMKPLYVELYNETDTTIPSITIEHGNFNTQERIQAIQLKPQERRIIALNHQPKLGFNIEANYANGEKISICAGKFSESYFLRETIYRSGIFTTEIR